MNSLTLVPNIFYIIAVAECQFLYVMVKVQKELFFCALKLWKIKLRETVLKSAGKLSLRKAPLQFYHHGND